MADAHSATGHRIVMQGAGKSVIGRARLRVLMTMIIFMSIYGVIAARLLYFGFQDVDASGSPASRVTASRPDIVDRNGEVLATDIKTASLFGEPRRIVDANEAIETRDRPSGYQLRADLQPADQRRRLRVAPAPAHPAPAGRDHAARHSRHRVPHEKRRFYPAGVTAAHIVGLTNIDNKGIAGMEKYVDDQGLADLQATGLAADLAPVKLSIDLRVQHVVHDELTRAMERYKAIAAGAVILSARTGEVLAMASLPDYDPNNPYNANEKDRLNRMSAGVYEMGSTIKAYTLAMGLDSGKVNLNSTFDATRPLHFGRFTIKDFHGKRRVLTVPEIFIYSSNIGSAKIADTIGIEGHREFIKRLGLLDRLDTELPEVASPTEPAEWKKLNSITIAFGHGMATTPLQTAVGAVALMNGGRLMNPTFLSRTPQEADAKAMQVLDPRTTDAMRYLFRLNVEKGSGRRADVPGYFVGGKTGTAEKVVNGRYSGDKRFNAFLSAFPIQDPEYVVLVILDEPKPEKPGIGATSGLNAAPLTSAIISRAAPLLGVKPEFGHESGALLVSHQ